MKNVTKKGWYKSFERAKSRCNNPNATKYKRYGGRGIEMLLTHEEINTLWERDLASSMKRPSIDRKENDGNYTFENCRFIEFEENSRRAERNNYPFKRKKVSQFSLEGKFIKTFHSIMDASKEMNCDHDSISSCVCGRNKTSCGFTWKYA